MGCGLRRAEAAALTVEQVQQRDSRWVIVDLRGKHGRIRTVPVPAWVKQAVDGWCEDAGITGGRILRSLNRHGQITGDLGLAASGLVDGGRSMGANWG